ncbi:MAG: 50S ribosomal protein L10 [Hydrogenophilus sp.]|nr:50S ribosomal protein L10 [Hydrogenophilus sp.]
MALSLEEKQAIVAEVAQQLAKAGAIVFAEYRGLTVAELTELRRKAREAGVYLRVLKNTLVRRAVQDTPFACLEGRLVGPLIFAIGADPTAPARLMIDFAKGAEKLVIQGGALPGSLLDPKGVEALAKMPSRAELLAHLVGAMQAPIAQFVRTLQEVPARFVRTLAAVRDAKEAA